MKRMPSPRWALVTGVSPGGMGEGEVKAFMDRGINVVATAQDIKLLDHLALNEKNGSASIERLELDVVSPDSIKAAVEKVTSLTDGRLDFLISRCCLSETVGSANKNVDNAGYGYYMPLLDVDIDKARKQYDVNVWGVLAVTQAFFPLLRAAKGSEPYLISILMLTLHRHRCQSG